MSTANRIGKLHLPDGVGPLTLTRMTAVERMSEPFTIVIDATSNAGPINLHPVLTKMVGIDFAGAEHVSRRFHGTLWEYVELGANATGDQYVYRLTLRPVLTHWTMNRTSKIHYKLKINELITNIASPWLTSALSGPYETVEYRVQYGESDFDFLTRNCEKEGIYYYYVHSATKHTIVFADALNHHTAMTPAVAYLESHAANGSDAQLSSLVERRSFAVTKYMVDDYDYDKPTVPLAADKTIGTLGAPPPRFNSGSVEVMEPVADVYDYPARYDNPAKAAGTRYAERWLEREQRRMARTFAEGNVFAAAVGKTIKVDYSRSMSHPAPPHHASDEEFLIVATTHRYTANDDRSGGGVEETLTVELELMPATKQYRPARTTPIPRIYGPQTAIVIGPPGEEIYTDKYGRVKVKFFWDKDTPADDTGSIWIRVGQSGAGSGFGSFMVPRINHEVIVEFLDGDPDRPIITGAVYNGSNLPAFGSAADNTVQGIKTNSSKGGGGYNEIKIDDKKDAELFSFHAQKDLKWVVDKGDETRDLLNGSRTTVIHKGDETMTVTKGKRTTTIQGDETTTVKGGNVSHTVSTGDVTRKIATGKRTTEIMGDDTLTIKTGNREASVKLGNDKLTVSVGDVDIKVSLGNHKTEAMQSIELKCGGSSFKMNPMQIEMKAMMIKIEGSLMFQTKGLMVQQEASAMHIVKGGIVMIN